MKKFTKNTLVWVSRFLILLAWRNREKLFEIYLSKKGKKGRRSWLSVFRKNK